jgi:hypothetical protein
LIVGEVALIEGLIAFDELPHRRLRLLRLLEIFRHVRDVILDLVFVLKRRPDGPAYDEELRAIASFERLSDDVIEDASV